MILHAAEQLSPQATATEPMCYTTKSHVPRAHALQQEKLPQSEARARQRRVAPTCSNLKRPVCSNEDPVQPKINK